MSKSNSGFSLVQVISTLGLMSVIAWVFASMLQQQQREVRALGEVLATRDLERLLIAALGSGEVCRYVLTEPSEKTFNSTNLSSQPQVIDLGAQPLYASINAGVPGEVVAEKGKNFSPTASHLLIDSIRLVISGGSGSTFTGLWQVTFDPTKSVRLLKPIMISTLLNVDASNPASARILGCQGAGAGGANPGIRILMHKCPVINKGALGGGVWGYYGCRGQIQSEPSCLTIESPNEMTFDCAPAGYMRLEP